MNVKLYKKVTTTWCMCFETECIMTLQGHSRSLILAQSNVHIGLPIGRQL